jgi:hypothetical protein
MRVLPVLLLILSTSSLLADPLEPLWCFKFGDAGADVMVALEVASDDRIYVTGDFTGGLDLGGEQLVSQGEYDIFLAAFSSEGLHLWSRSFGDFGNDKVRDLVVDDDGNVIIVGDFFYGINFGGGELYSAGDKDAFIAKYNGNGHHLWSAHFGDANYQSASCVEVDSNGHLFLAGPYLGTMNFGGTDISSFDGQDLFLASLDADGSHLWSQSIWGFGDQWVFDLDMIEGSDLAMAGSLEGYMYIGNEALASQGDLDAYLLLISPATGALSWGQAFGVNGDQEARCLAIQETGDIIFAGDFEYGISLGDNAHNSAGGRDLFLASLSENGLFNWSQSFGDDAGQYAEALAVGPYGEIGFTGFVDGGVDFGGGVIDGAGYFDIFMATFGPDGSHRSSALYGDQSDQRGIDVAVDSANQFVLGSWFFGYCDFYCYSGGFISAGNADMALVKYQRDPTATPSPSMLANLSAYPNPFNPKTEIRFHLEESANLELDIYDLAGRHLRGLVKPSFLEAGEHRVSWDGRDERGVPLSAGIYFCSLKAGLRSESMKLVLLK